MGRVDESVWSSRSRGRSGSVCLAFLSITKAGWRGEESSEENLTAPTVGPETVFYTRIFWVPWLPARWEALHHQGACRTALRGCWPRAPPHLRASAPLPAVPIPAPSGEPPPQERSHTALAQQSGCSWDSLPGYLKSGPCTYTTASQAVLVTQQELGRRGF